MEEEKNIEINSDRDTWFLDQTVSIEMSRNEKTNEEYLTILSNNRKELERCKVGYVTASINEDDLDARAYLNKIKRIINVNHFIMHRLTHNGINYEVYKYEFERPKEIVERMVRKCTCIDGGCSNCNSKGYTDGIFWTNTCRSCNGSRKCSKCNGVGYLFIVN